MATKRERILVASVIVFLFFFFLTPLAITEIRSCATIPLETPSVASLSFLVFGAGGVLNDGRYLWATACV